MGIQERLDEQKGQKAALLGMSFGDAKEAAKGHLASLAAKYDLGCSKDSFEYRVGSARSMRQLEEEVSIMFSREINEMIHEAEKGNRLAEILNYMSGDSWNGTHDRSIDVSIKGDTVTVKNSYMGSAMTETFTKDELNTLAKAEVVRFTRYYQDYTYALEVATAQSRKPAAIRIEAGAFISEVVDNGKDMTVRLPHFGQPLALNVEKPATIDIRPQDGIKFVFDAATGKIDKEEGVTFYRKMEPIAKVKFTG